MPALTHDIVEGKHSVDDARAFYAKTAMATMKGETSPYVQKLQFDASMRGAVADTPATGMKEAMKDLVSSDSNSFAGQSGHRVPE